MLKTSALEVFIFGKTFNFWRYIHAIKSTHAMTLSHGMSKTGSGNE
jgi:hypothetical protein